MGVNIGISLFSDKNLVRIGAQLWPLSIFIPTIQQDQLKMSPENQHIFNDDYKPSGKKGNLVEKNSQFRISLPTEV